MVDRETLTACGRAQNPAGILVVYQTGYSRTDHVIRDKHYGTCTYYISSEKIRFFCFVFVAATGFGGL